jgi:hypothetical protein
LLLLNSLTNSVTSTSTPSSIGSGAGNGATGSSTVVLVAHHPLLVHLLAHHHCWFTFWCHHHHLRYQDPKSVDTFSASTASIRFYMLVLLVFTEKTILCYHLKVFLV